MVATKMAVTYLALLLVLVFSANGGDETTSDKRNLILLYSPISEVKSPSLNPSYSEWLCSLISFWMSRSHSSVRICEP